MAYYLRVFSWDAEKDRINQEKHGVSFSEAKLVFDSEESCMELYDEENSKDEDRFIRIGPIASGTIHVVFTERCADVVRIISARRATPREITLLQRTLGGRK